MAINFNFRLAESKKDFDLLGKVLIKYPLNYRGYYSWCDRAIDEVFLGYKKAQLAFYENYLIGYLLSQSSKSMKDFHEMKSARVLEEFQRRFILSFMIRQEEVEAKKAGNLAMICDIRSNRQDVIKLLKYNQYREINRADIYNEGYEDVIFIKPLEQNLKTSSLFMFNGASKN